MSSDSARGAGAKKNDRRRAGRTSRRGATARRSFAATWRALDALAASGAQLAVRVEDLDTGEAVLAGDDFVALPVAGLGVVPLLIEVAARFEDGTLDPAATVDRAGLEPVGVSGIWQHLRTTTLPLVDLAVLAASSGDALAANALLERVGLRAVRRRAERLGMRDSALMDGFRDRRGPDDAPHVALGRARDFAMLFREIANANAVEPRVSAQVAEWLSRGQDLSLVGAATGLDPFAHEDDEHGLLFVNKTGQATGVRAEAGALAGPRAGVAYALVVCFDDLSVSHRIRAHHAFQVLGTDLMEYVH